MLKLVNKRFKTGVKLINFMILLLFLLGFAMVAESLGILKIAPELDQD